VDRVEKFLALGYFGRLCGQQLFCVEIPYTPRTTLRYGFPRKDAISEGVRATKLGRGTLET